MLRKMLSLFAVVLFGAGFLFGCGSSSSAADTISVADQNIKVGDVIEPEVTFTPITSIDSYGFTAPDESVVSIKNHFITGEAAGTVTVTCTTNNTGVSTTFVVTVTVPEINASIAAFNEAGTFENGLSAWTLSGETASVMSTENDADREQEDMQLKLFTDGLIDFTIGYTLANLPAGPYTFSFEIAAGNLTVAVCRINGHDYVWSDGDFAMGTSYIKNYFFLETTAAQNVGFSLYFYAPAADKGWGYLDNIMIEEGDTRPGPEIGPKNYVNDGSFESAGLTNWTLAGTCGGTLVVNAKSPHSGSKNLDYWGNDVAGDNFTLSQTIASVDAGSHYTARLFILNGDDNSAALIDSYFYVKQGDVIQQVAITNLGWATTMFEVKIENLTLTAGAAEIGLHIQPGSAEYWMQVDDIQLLNADILA